jgi:hypothetical protein
MKRRLGLFLALWFAWLQPLDAQQTNEPRIVGDTSGAPAGCSAKVAIETIKLWFAAFNAADSAGLLRATAPRFVFSTGKHWRASDTHIRIERHSTLLAYARGRTRRWNERFALDSIHFYGWRGVQLGFMPYYRRSAGDLGAGPLGGLGKAAYECPGGIRVLNLAPRVQVRSDRSGRL